MEAAGRSREQSIAASLRNARQYGAKLASGGITPPFGARMAAKNLAHEGFLHSSVPGRTDKLPISVSGGSYVLPADHVAALGQGNSLAGSAIVNKMFKMPTGNIASIRSSVPKLNLRAKADGGAAEDDTTPIIAAGGEIVLPPDKIVERFGDLESGHKALDKWVVDTRKKHIQTLRGLKPPKKD